MVDEWQANAMTNLAIACVVVPDFPLRIESVRHPELDGLPLALTDAAAQRRLIVECSPEAAAEGIRVGMTVRDAINACPRAVILSADPVHYAAVFAELLRGLLDVSPGVEAGDLGVAWVDLRGLERLYAGREVVVARLLGVRQLARRVCARQVMRGRGARQARVQLLIESQRSWERVVVLKGAVGDAERLAGLLAGRLAGLTVEGPVEEIALELSGLTTVHARQGQLFEADLRRRRQQDIDEAVGELKQRYGLSPLFSLTPVEPWSRIPERRWGLLARE